MLVREVAGDANNPELVREELGHILQTAVEGLKAGEQVGAPRSDVLTDAAVDEPADDRERDPPAPGPQPTAAIAPSAGSRPLRLGLIYELLWLGAGARFAEVRVRYSSGAPMASSSSVLRRPLKVEADRSA